MKRFLPLLLPVLVLAEEATPKPWTDVATLSYVATSGNAIGQTIGLGNDYTHKWSLSTLAVKLGAIRAESTLVQRFAIADSLEAAKVQEQRRTTLTAATYFLNARYDYRLKDKDRWYWYSASGWERNRPAGLENRFVATAGMGRIWLDSERSKWRTDAGFGTTREDPLVAPPDFRHTFATFNFTSSLKHRFNGSVDYAADLAATDNLRDTTDWIATFKQGLTVAMTRRMALKVGLDLNYRNRPNLIAVEVRTPADPTVVLGKVIIAAKKLDTVTTTSFVITF